MTEIKVGKIFANKKLLGMIGLLIVLLIVVFGPVLSLLNERLSSNRQLNVEFSKLAAKIETLEGIDEDLTTQRVNKMEEVFPSTKPVVKLLSALNQLSSNNNLSFGGVTLRPGSLSEKNTAKESPLADLQFSFEVSGSFDSISIFLTSLEKVAPLMKIDNVGLAIKSKPLVEREATLVTANISVSAYYQAPPASLGGVSAAVKLLSREDEVLLSRLFSFESFGTVIPTAPTGNLNLFQEGPLESL
jgi:Tfp pilus assembly protein PilO